MAKKISSSTSSKSSSYQTKKSSKKSEEKKSGKTESSGKSSESKSPVKESPSEGSIIQKKECPSDKLNISSDAIEEKKDKKEVPGDFYEKMSEVRDNVINKPEVESFAQKKEEVNIEDLKEILSKREDSGEKIDMESLFEATEEEIELGGSAFKKIEEAHKIGKNITGYEDVKERDYERPVDRREDVRDLWDSSHRGEKDTVDGVSEGRRNDFRKPVADKGPEGKIKGEGSAEGSAGMEADGKLRKGVSAVENDGARSGEEKTGATGKINDGQGRDKSVSGKEEEKTGATGKINDGQGRDKSVSGKEEEKTGATGKIDDGQGRDKSVSGKEEEKTGATGKIEGQGRDKSDSGKEEDGKKTDEGKIPGIDTSKLSDGEKKMIESLGIDNMKPGDEINITADMLAEFGVGYGVTSTGGGASGFISGQGQVTLKRDENNPNKFILSSGTELMGGLKADEGGGPQKVEGKGGVEGGISIELEVDFSKKGEFYNTMSYLARCRNPAIDAADAMANDKLPGDPSLKFFADHFKSIEVQGGLSKETCITLGEGLGVDNTITDELMAGGKLERQKDDKTGKTTGWDLSRSVGVASSFKNDLFVGTQELVDLKAKTTGAELHGGLSLEKTTHFPLNENGEVDLNRVNEELDLKVNVGGEINEQAFSTPGMVNPELNPLTTKGFNLEGSASINDIMAVLPEESRKELQEAVKNNDYEKIQKICQDTLPNIKFKGKLDTFEHSGISGELGIKGKEGVGGGGNISGELGYTTPTSSYEGGITLNKDGVEVDGSYSRDGVKQGGTDEPYKATWEELAGGVKESYEDMEEISV